MHPPGKRSQEPSAAEQSGARSKRGRGQGGSSPAQGAVPQQEPYGTETGKAGPAVRREREAALVAR